MAARTPAMKTVSGGPGKRAVCSVLFFPTCGATGPPLLRELSRRAVDFTLGSGIHPSGLNSGPAHGACPRDAGGRHFGA